MAESRKIPTSTTLFWIGVILVLIMGGVLALFWNRLPPQLPWLYSFPSGDKQLVDKIWFVWIFAGMEVVLFLTRILASWAGKGDNTVQTTISLGVLIAVVLMVASFAKIMLIFLNI